MTVSELAERDLITRIRQLLPPAPSWLVVGIGDDAAVVQPERSRLDVLSVDAIVEGVHFDRRFTPPAAIGHRALAVNLSDLAAMGAAPRLALLSLALPPTLPCDDFDGIVQGLVAVATRHRVHVAGGNVTRTSGPLVLDVTVSGTVKRRGYLTRHQARAGDELYVSGTLGAAAAGLECLRASDGVAGTSEGCVQRYLYPDPRVRAGMLLSRNRAATACMDLSDGLADAARQLAEASGIGIVIDAADVPVDPGARAWFERTGADPLTEAIRGGDDYELLFTVKPRHRGRLAAARQHGGVTLTRIGLCTSEREVVLRRTAAGGPADEPLPSGFRHFR